MSTDKFSFEHLTVPMASVDMLAVFALSLILACVFIHVFFLSSPGPTAAEEFPWAGGYKQPIGRRVASIYSLLIGKRLLQESYDKYCKNGIACIVPGIFGNQFALPPKLASWLLDQPDSVLSAKHAQADAIEAQITMLSPDVSSKPFHEDTVRRRLKKKSLEDLHYDMIDEVIQTVKAEFGSDETNFSSIDLDTAIRKIVASVSNRVFVGEALCRNNSFIENAIAYVHDIPLSGLFIKLFPGFLQPFIGKAAIILNRLHFSRCASYLQPLLEQRIELYRQDPETMPDDFVSCLVQDIMKRKVAAEKTSLMMTRRMMALNFAAIHTSTMTTVNLLLDIISGPEGLSCTQDLLKEYQALSNVHKSSWNRERLDSMTVTDSALRESMRLSGFGSRLFTRRVVSKAGVTLPDGGHIPNGSTIFVPGYPLHHDPEIYPEPFSFKHDRFQKKSVTSADGAQESTAKSAVTTELSYGIWSHGRHACPGRYFAVDLIKMVVGHILQEYEIKPLAQRPKNIWIADTPIPPRNFCIEIKKRSALELGSST